MKQKLLEEFAHISAIFMIFFIVVLVSFCIGFIKGENKMHDGLRDSLITYDDYCDGFNTSVNIDKTITPNQKDYTFSLSCVGVIE